MLLCATLPLAAQTFWDGTADKNLPGEGSEASPYLSARLNNWRDWLPA